jgi:3-oxoacyl-[acyl-carrier protein] reductase
VRLKGKIALITGSSKGIGNAIALAYANEGASIVINGRNENELLLAEERLNKLGSSVLAVSGDVSIKGDIENMIAKCMQKYGRIDILVNNAGQIFSGGVEDISENDWDRCLTVNLKSVFLCSNIVIPIMKKQNQGCIINISSMASKYTKAVSGANYGAAKAGVNFLTKRMAQDLGKNNITVNAICPGPIETELSKKIPEEIMKEYVKGFALGRIGQPQDVANLAVFLGSDTSSYITGEVIDVCGGSFID